MPTTTTTPVASDVQPTLRLLSDLFPAEALTRVSFRLWEGTRWPDPEPRLATVVLKHSEALREMFATGTEKALAEAYIYDHFDVEGDLEAACDLADILRARAEESWLRAARQWNHLRRRAPSQSTRAWTKWGDLSARRNSKARDRQAIAFHYDVSNDFFRLWLDSKMLYSCAYFEREADDLETAQAAKLRHLCRKLRLKPHERLLDVGCGWGSLAIFAAQGYCAEVKGITLSNAQASLATTRVQNAGLASDVTIELRDYRDLDEPEAYDAVVSVGMAEHVGASKLSAYFKKMFGLLKPGGVFLNHAIGDGIRARPPRGPSFIQEYVFPDSDLPPISHVVTAAESAGFEVRDVENLREHYMMTLRHWVRRLERAHDAALQFVNEPTYRVWRLYMAASARAFERGRLALYQTLLVKPDEHGRANLPLTREDWYVHS